MKSFRVCGICTKRTLEHCSNCNAAICSQECQKLASVSGHRLECRNPDTIQRNWTTELVNSFVAGPEVDGSSYVIGKGGAGTVYANDRIDPNVVIKMSRIRESCKQCETDFKIATRIAEQTKKLGFQNSHACVVEVFSEIPEIHGSDGFKRCALVQQRVFRPSGLPFSEDVLSYHAYLGEPDWVKKHNDRGIYLGAKQIAEVIDPLPLVELAKAMGNLIGFLHYGVRCDAGDMEYLLGKTENREDSPIKVIAVDFDRMKFYSKDQMTSDEARRMFSWSIRQESYFPERDEEELFPAFETAYLHQASRFGYLKVAEAVLEDE
jgi:hypothetical protein